MIAAIVTMFVVTALALIVFILINPKAFPILVGQHWHMPGIGTVIIVRVLGPNATFQTSMPGLSVMYRLPDSSYGFCRKNDLRNFAKLLPYDYKKDLIKQKEIENILNEMERKKSKFQTYTPPGPEIQDAEIVTDPTTSRALKQYRRVMSYTRNIRGD